MKKANSQEGKKVHHLNVNFENKLARGKGCFSLEALCGVELVGQWALHRKRRRVPRVRRGPGVLVPLLLRRFYARAVQLANLGALTRIIFSGVLLSKF